VLNKSGFAPEDIDYFVAHSPNRNFPLKAGLEAGFNRDQIDPGLVVAKIGNLYAGSSLTSLAAVLDIAKPEEKIVMVSYGSGAGSDAYIFTVTDKILEKRKRTITVESQIENPHKQYVDYANYRKWKEMI
jgi:hydroxymethylglutaryl-CoA synthase